MAAIAAAFSSAVAPASITPTMRASRCISARKLTPSALPRLPTTAIVPPRATNAMSAAAFLSISISTTTSAPAWPVPSSTARTTSSAEWSTARLAPASTTAARPAAVDAEPMIGVAPRKRASCTAARPTPPLAPCTNTDFPAAHPAAASARQAVRYDEPSAAPAASGTCAGSGTASASATRQCEAYVPVTLPASQTRAPGATRVTPSPTASTVPAPSLPGVHGSDGSFA